MKTEQETGNKNSRKCDSVELKSLDGLADMSSLRGVAEFWEPTKWEFPPQDLLRFFMKNPKGVLLP